jgi:cAMP phosphodiesterase
LSYKPKQVKRGHLRELGYDLLENSEGKNMNDRKEWWIISIRIEKEANDKLNDYVKNNGIKKGYIVTKAINEYLEKHKTQQ